MKFKVGILLCLWIIAGVVKKATGTISVISEETGETVRIIEDRNIRSMSDALEGYVINSNPPNVCEIPDQPPAVVRDESTRMNNNSSSSTLSKIKFILLGVIHDCDLTTKARNAQQSGYSGLIIQNIGTNNSHLIPWHIMRFPLAKINHVVVGEFDGTLLRNNYSYPDNGYYIKFEEDHFYQVLCYVLAGIILLLLSTMFLLFWFQVCCTIIALRLPYRLGQRFQSWLHPSKRRLTRPMLQLLPVKNWSSSDPFQVCAICQEDFLEEEKVRLLPCSHAFHSACIDPWLLKRSRRCPNCMQRVKLPNEQDDDDESEYSSVRTQNRSHHSRHRRCSQSSHHDNRSSAANDNAPLIDLPESPKNRGGVQGVLQGDTEDPEYVVVTAVEENSVSTRDWQLKRFLQSFNYVPSSDGSRSCSINNTKPKEIPLKSGKSTPNLKSEIVTFTSIPLCSLVRVEDAILLETCLDVPATGGYSQKNSSISVDETPYRVVDVEGDNSVSVSIDTPVAAATQGQGQATSANDDGGAHGSASSAPAAAPREYSNPGYVSFDEDEDDEEDASSDEEATEEQNITSSFDATTISESLPCDDASLQISNRLDYDNDDIDDSVMSDIFQETDP